MALINEYSNLESHVLTRNSRFLYSAVVKCLKFFIFVLLLHVDISYVMRIITFKMCSFKMEHKKMQMLLWMLQLPIETD